MPRLILLNKPYLVQCKFTDADGRPTLADHLPVKNIYAAGRLDADSEGLVVLTEAGWVQTRIAEPNFKLAKTYLVQVEGAPDEIDLEPLRTGVLLSDGQTRPATVERIVEPEWLWDRLPPIRFRKAIPTTWLQLTITEGRNRQVRRMTAAIGFPALRLIRVAVGPWKLEALEPGQWREDAIPRDWKRPEPVAMPPRYLKRW